MSSWASIEIGGMSVIETQNYYTQWYFRKSERSHTYLGEDVDVDFPQFHRHSTASQGAV